jgi:DNA-directed RNA polymerase subunit E'/Rpb7
MNKGAIWDNIRQVWVWQINDRKGEYTEGEKIRVRVAKNQLNLRNANGDIIVRCDEDGLGLIKWWNI